MGRPLRPGEMPDRHRLAAALDLRIGSLADGRALVAEALTDCHEANTTLGHLASRIRAAVLHDSAACDSEIGRIVREAVVGYARESLAA